MIKAISIFSLLIAVAVVPTVFAQVSSTSNYAPPECVICVHEWIKNNAGWWADGIIDDGSFVSGIEWLVSNDIIEVPPTAVSGTAESTIPGWVKNTAGWWAGDQISDDDFVNAIQHLIKVGIMAVPQAEKVAVVEKPTYSSSTDSGLATEINQLKSQLAKCDELEKASDAYLCGSKIKDQIEIIEYMMESEKHELGPVHMYYKPSKVTINPDGNSVVELVLGFKNTDSKNQSLYCSGPSSCNIELTDGKKSWIYSANNIPTGRLEMKPDTSHLIKFTFGPPAQRHLDRWDYDASSEYFLEISESYANYKLPLKLTVK